MQILLALAQTFRVTPFDVLFFIAGFFLVFGAFYFIPLRTLYEIAFGGIVGLGVYILLSILLIGNAPLGTQGGLLPFGFSVFIISAVVYLVLLLPIVFPLQWGLILAETTNPILYTLQYMLVGGFLLLSFFAVLIYMVEQEYIFQVKTILIWIRDMAWYQEFVRPSSLFRYVIEKQNSIIPLAVLLMIYKLFLSNLLAAIVMTIAYNIMHAGFYKKKESSSYRVEFHEVWWWGGGTEEIPAPSEHRE